MKIDWNRGAKIVFYAIDITGVLGFITTILFIFNIGGVNPEPRIGIGSIFVVIMAMFYFLNSKIEKIENDICEMDEKL